MWPWPHVTSQKPQRELAALLLLSPGQGLPSCGHPVHRPGCLPQSWWCPGGDGATQGCSSSRSCLGSTHSPEERWPEDTSAPPVCCPPCLHPLHSTVLHQHPAFCLLCTAPCCFHHAGPSLHRRLARGCWLRLHGCGETSRAPSCTGSTLPLAPSPDFFLP